MTSQPDPKLPDPNSAESFDQRRIWEHAQNVAPESFAGAQPRLDFLLRQIARRSRDQRPTVLNIGVGAGYFERQASGRGWLIHSLDPDEQSMQRLAEEGIRTHVGFIENLPFDDDTFDFVVASEVLEHLSDAQRRTGCREIERVLKPDGWFLGTVPYREDLSLRQCICPQCGLQFHQYGHLASFDFPAVQTMLNGPFRLDALGRSAFVSYRGRGVFGMLKSLLRAVLGKLGQQLAVPRLFWIAQKC